MQESESKLHAVGDNLPDSFVYQYTKDETGAPQFTYLSAGVERVHGVSPRQVQADISCLFSQIDPLQRPAFAEAEAESARHLKSLDSFARAAEAAINHLEHDLQQLADAVTRDPTLACSASALHMEATGIASACGAWVHVSASLARRLARECELMQARLLNHARCRKLALSVMQKAKLQAMLIH